MTPKDPIDAVTRRSENPVLNAEKIIEFNDNMLAANAVVKGKPEYVARAVHGELIFDLDSTQKRDADPEVTSAVGRLKHRLGYRIFKRGMDIVFSGAVLILFCWLFVIIAIAIKVDDPKGPILFRQERVGRSKSDQLTSFEMLKFRSMYNGAEAQLGGLKEFNEKSGPVFKIKNDPRITRVGRILRKTSLDELPQFINVFFGVMTTCGPRPALMSETVTYNERHKQRLLVKPGITCYWQTRKNRDSITFDEWVDLDLLYIKQCGPWADFKLIVQTVGVVLTAQGS